MQEHPEGILPDETGSKLAVIVAGLAGGYLVRTAIEGLYPRPWSSLDSFDLEFAVVFYLPSVFFLLWAVIAAPAWRRTSLRWAKHLVVLHAVSILLVAVARGGKGAWMIYPFFTIPGLLLLVLYPGRKVSSNTLRFTRNATLVLSGGHVAALLLWSWATIPLIPIAESPDLSVDGSPS